ncbi:hypothetical protein M0R45_032365 [Rubus argutus]|uniref:1-acylglycerol-3-phosphate O-acyltransferase n=1 Tax=Rubus argutus TaxID=59490 RepID=A0AAW1WIJ7_RUBAR
MAIALGILFPLIVFLYPLFLYLILMLLLCISALFANLIQALCFVCIWPISKNTYRKIKRVVKELDWLVLVFLIDWWARIKVYIKRHAAKESPETDDAVEKWCTDIFAAKDALLDKHIAEQTFGDQGLQAIGCHIFGMSTCGWGSKVQLGPLLYTACIQCCPLFWPDACALRPWSAFTVAVFRSMQAYLTNINWSEHLLSILFCLLDIFFNCLDHMFLDGSTWWGTI